MAQQRHVTMHDVARRAGVSVKTVSNVVNDYPFVRDSTRAKVLAAIDELGYSINMTAKNLRQGHSNIIGLSIPDPRMPYFAELSAYVMEEARTLGKHVIFNPSGVDRQTELDVLHGSLSTLTDGLIFSPLHLNANDATAIHVDYPLVIIGEHLRLDTYDRVLTENTTGIRNATARLIELGCRRIAIIGVHEWERDYGSSPYRLKGYRQALAAAGLPNDPALEIPAVIWYQPDGADAVARMLDGGIRPRRHRLHERPAGDGRDAGTGTPWHPRAPGREGHRLRRFDRFAVPLPLAELRESEPAGGGADVAETALRPHRGTGARRGRAQWIRRSGGAVQAGGARIQRARFAAVAGIPR